MTTTQQIADKETDITISRILEYDDEVFKIVVVEDEKDAEVEINKVLKFAAKILNENNEKVFVGFDCEWKSGEAYKKGKISMLQVSYASTILLIRLCKGNLANSKKVIKLLESNQIIKVGLNMWNKKLKFFKDYNIDLNNYIDLGVSFWESKIFNKEKSVENLDNVLKEQYKGDKYVSIKSRKQELTLSGLFYILKKRLLSNKLDYKSGDYMLWDEEELPIKLLKYSAINAFYVYKCSQFLFEKITVDDDIRFGLNATESSDMKVLKYLNRPFLNDFNSIKKSSKFIGQYSDSKVLSLNEIQSLKYNDIVCVREIKGTWQEYKVLENYKNRILMLNILKPDITRMIYDLNVKLVVKANGLKKGKQIPLETRENRDRFKKYDIPSNIMFKFWEMYVHNPFYYQYAYPYGYAPPPPPKNPSGKRGTYYDYNERKYSKQLKQPPKRVGTVQKSRQTQTKRRGQNVRYSQGYYGYYTNPNQQYTQQRQQQRGQKRRVYGQDRVQYPTEQRRYQNNRQNNRQNYKQNYYSQNNRQRGYQSQYYRKKY